MSLNIKCENAFLYKVVESQSLSKEGKIVSLSQLENMHNTAYQTDGRYATTLENISTGKKITIETVIEIKNKKQFYAVFDNTKCLQKTEIDKSTNEGKLRQESRIWNGLAIWPKGKCIKTDRMSKLLEKFKYKISLKDLQDNNFTLVEKKTNLWIYFTPPKYTLAVSVLNNLCKGSICSVNKKMEVKNISAYNNILFDDDGKIYYPENLQ